MVSKSGFVVAVFSSAGKGLELGRGTNMGHVVLEYSRMDYSGCQSIEFAGLAVMAFDG